MTRRYDTTSAIKRQALSEEFEGILGCVQTAPAGGPPSSRPTGSLPTDPRRPTGPGSVMPPSSHKPPRGERTSILTQGGLELFGDGAAGDRRVVEDGREVRRLEALHRREIQNVFGLFAVERAVSGAREGQRIAAVPLDHRLGLPQGKHSCRLQDWEQPLAAEVPSATVRKS